jgi:hypothetical protein
MLKSLMRSVMYAVSSVMLFSGSYYSWDDYQISGRCINTVEARTDNDYIITTRMKIIYTKSYKIGYSFTINGTRYNNYETIRTEPTGAVQVHYNPDNPRENRVEKAGFPWIILVTLPGGMLMLIPAKVEFDSFVGFLKSKFKE